MRSSRNVSGLPIFWPNFLTYYWIHQRSNRPRLLTARGWPLSSPSCCAWTQRRPFSSTTRTSTTCVRVDCFCSQLLTSLTETAIRQVEVEYESQQAASKVQGPTPPSRESTQPENQGTRLFWGESCSTPDTFSASTSKPSKQLQEKPAAKNKGMLFFISISETPD